MTELQDNKRKALHLALDTYGADLTRMPEQTAKMVKDLIDNSSEAAALFKEAKTLDDTLNNIDRDVDWDLGALKNNILTAAQNQPVKTNHSPQITPANDNWVRELAAPGLLAASLLFGIFFGAFGGANLLMGDHTDITIASADLSNDILLLDTDFIIGEE